MAMMLEVSGKSIQKAAEVLRNGGTVIYPTETCYGLGCDAADEEAVERIYDIKQRPREKKLTVIVSDLEMAESYCTLTPEEERLVEDFMPGPLTLVAEKKGNVPDALNTSFVFRIPGNDTAIRLAGEAGVPVVATSANISGEEPAYAVDDLSKDIVGSVDIVLDGSRLEERPSSTIAEIKNGKVNLIREGPVPIEELEACLVDFSG